MWREPWFRIIDVTEIRGRSMADMADPVIKKHRVSLREVRGNRRDKFIVSVRRELIALFMQERHDLSSYQIGDFLSRDPATIRHHMAGLRA